MQKRTLRPAPPPEPVAAPLVQQIDRLAAGIQLLRAQLTTLDAHVAAPVRPTLLSPEEAAAELDVGRSTVYRLMDAGELRRVHIGKCTRIPRGDLDRYVARLLGESA